MSGQYILHDGRANCVGIFTRRGAKKWLPIVIANQVFDAFDAMAESGDEKVITPSGWTVQVHHPEDAPQ